MGKLFILGLTSVVFLTNTQSMIMRNNALMSKMVSQFQGKENKDQRENRPREEDRDTRRGSEERDTRIQVKNPEEHVLSLMQNVLCKNFPSVPCELITKDGTLRALIEKSIQQLKYKKMTMEKPTSPPNYQLTLFPVINSEDLSSFLQVSNTGVFKSKKKAPKKKNKEKNRWSHEKKTKSKSSVINGRKKIRKFYPHKIKYKDKNEKRDFEYSDEKLSMSVETPKDHSSNVMMKHFSYRGDPSDPPVWRIDYTKHGEPSINNMFGYEADNLSAKIIKTGPNVIVDDNILEQAVRRDVLHPDVYIKKSYTRKKNENSELVE